ncbi:MAG: hypothetical protein QW734_02870 [Candidatus Bathyarchaeia archaeon]
MLKLFRITANIFSFFLLLIAGYYLLTFNTVWAFIVFISAIDQLEDAYELVYNRRLIPAWLIPFDVIFEGILVVASSLMLIYSVIYYWWFESFTILIMLVVSLIILFSALQDLSEAIKTIAKWLISPSSAKYTFSIGRTQFKHYRRKV